MNQYLQARAREYGRVVAQTGSVSLIETARQASLDQAMSAALAPCRKPRAVHDPGESLVDLAWAVALGGATRHARRSGR